MQQKMADLATAAFDDFRHAKQTLARRAAIVTIVAIVACALPWEKILLQNANVESMFKNCKYLLNYAGLVIPGEATARLTSFLALCCSHTTLWLKWPNVNMAFVLLEGGLLVRGARVTYCALAKALTKVRGLDAREEYVYSTFFAPHGLSKREVVELLDAGAEWRSYEPPACSGPISWHHSIRKTRNLPCCAPIAKHLAGP